MQRREFISTSGIAAAAMAAMAGPKSAEAGDPSFMNNVPDPLLAGKELPTFKFELEKSRGQGHRRQLRQGGHGRAAADLQGDRRRLDEARAGRDARAALARHRRRVGLRHRGAGPHHRHRPAAAAPRRTTSRPGDIWYFPARPRPHARVPGRQALPLHPDLRQRLFLRVRHVQHHRLDRPHPQGAPGEELRPARIGLRRLPEGRGLLRPRAGAAGEAGHAAPGAEAAAADAQVPAARAAAASDVFKGGREWRVDADRSRSRRRSRA